jgi:tetratricopeptide (TPR) repeat protein
MSRTSPLIAAGFSAALGALFLLPGQAAVGQPVRGRILRGLELRPIGAGLELGVHFGVPVRYVRHSPAAVGDVVAVQLTLLTRAPEALAGREREVLRPRSDAPTAVEEVLFDGGGRGGSVLEIRFRERVRFEVHQGSDLRSLRIRISEPQPPRAAAPVPLRPLKPPVPPRAAPESSAAGYLAVQLWAGPRAAPAPPVPADLVGSGRRVYTVPFEREGEKWRRLRVGLFDDPRDAERARRKLDEAFPGAWVVSAGRSDRLAFEAEAPAWEREAVARAETSPGGSARSPALQSGPARVGAEVWLEEARAAMTRGELDRAVALLTKAIEASQEPHSADARELLGVVRERKGQLAHARAEFETYLEEHPEGPGAERVRQRLDAMLSARAAPEAPLREARWSREGLQIETFGSAYLSYRRLSRRAETVGRIFSDEAIFSDLFAGVRARTPRFELYGELSGSYLYGLEDRGESELQTSTLFVEARDFEGPLSGAVGRLPGNAAGVIGRYDGTQVSFRLDPKWSVSGVAGFPVDPFESNAIETDRRFVGASLDAAGLLSGLDGQIFAIHQQLHGETDRSAIGGEFRYVHEGLFVAGLVDYDLHFGELGQAFFVAGWQATDSTHLNLLLDHRHVPVLTTRNALIGQPEGSLAELRRRLSRSEIDTIAEDRTAWARTATLGLTQHLAPDLQLAIDVAATDLSGTRASSGVEGFSGSGWQFAYSAQLVASELLRSGDISIVGLRFFDSRVFDEAGVLLSWRAPLTRSVRLNPFVDLTRATLANGEAVYGVEPGLRIDWRLGAVSVDLEASYVWLDGERFIGAEDESGYHAVLGLRYDF